MGKCNIYSSENMAKLIRDVLDVSAHLYKRVCPSVRRSVRPSVRRFRKFSHCLLLHEDASLASGPCLRRDEAKKKRNKDKYD